MKNHIIVKLVKAAKARHGGKRVHIYPGIHRCWHQSHNFQDGWHELYYKLNRKEKTCHCIAMDTNGKLLTED